MADFIEHIRKLRVTVQNLVTRVVVDRSEDAGDYQVVWGGDRVTSGLEHLEPQGIHFRAAADAGGIVVSAGGVKEAGVLIMAGGIIPKDTIGAGEGGLHYLGEWKLFLRADGQLCLGQKTPADWVALASKVDSEIERIKSDLDALKSAYDTHTHMHSPGPSAPAPTAPPGAPAPDPSSPTSVASAKVRCA